MEPVITKWSVLWHFWHCYESEVDKSDNSSERATSAPPSREAGRKTTSTTTTKKTTTTNPPQEKQAEARACIFSIWADGNLRLLHIGLCVAAAEVLCNSRARLLPSLFRSLYLSSSLPLPPPLLLYTTSSSSPSFVFLRASRFRFDELAYVCAYIYMSLSCSLHFLSFFSLSRSTTALCIWCDQRGYI